jgi:hypothetical protein|tara:strand:- start:414 stop:530 length:117 start_codon:yes stop_codon:yes gene_type:complete
MVLKELGVIHFYKSILAYLTGGIEFKGTILPFDSLYAY